jgi:hypothetical protein
METADVLVFRTVELCRKTTEHSKDIRKELGITERWEMQKEINEKRVPQLLYQYLRPITIASTVITVCTG